MDNANRFMTPSISAALSLKRWLLVFRSTEFRSLSARRVLRRGVLQSATMRKENRRRVG